MMHPEDVQRLCDEMRGLRESVDDLCEIVEYVWNNRREFSELLERPPANYPYESEGFPLAE